MSNRPIFASMLRGLRLRCPNCGRGRILSGYLRVNPVCRDCGEQYGHIQADDGPAWATILIVGHVMVSLALWIEQVWAPPLLAFSIWASIGTLGMTVALLPPIKGAFVSVMWAHRLRGDETHEII